MIIDPYSNGCKYGVVELCCNSVLLAAHVWSNSIAVVRTMFTVFWI
jgi:hypothetical protein